MSTYEVMLVLSGLRIIVNAAMKRFIKKLMLLFAAAAFASGCAVAPPDSSAADKSAYDDLKNARVSFRQWGTFQLEDGEYRDYRKNGQDGWTVGIEYNFCRRFMFNDAEYHVALAYVNGGGTAWYYYLLVFKNRETIDAVVLDDRIVPVGMNVSDGILRFTYMNRDTQERLWMPPTVIDECVWDMREVSKSWAEYEESFENLDVLRVTYLKNAEFIRVLAYLRVVLRNGDAVKLAELFEYPQHFYDKNHEYRTVKTSKELIAAYDEIFTPLYRNNLIVLLDGPYKFRGGNLILGDDEIIIAPPVEKYVRPKIVSMHAKIETDMLYSNRDYRELHTYDTSE